MLSKPHPILTIFTSASVSNSTYLSIVLILELLYDLCMNKDVCTLHGERFVCDKQFVHEDQNVWRSYLVLGRRISPSRPRVSAPDFLCR
jgi:hypothetical protein